MTSSTKKAALAPLVSRHETIEDLLSALETTLYTLGRLGGNFGKDATASSQDKDIRNAWCHARGAITRAANAQDARLGTRRKGV